MTLLEAEESKFLQHDNPYLRVEVSEGGEILMGILLSELKDADALKSRLDDLYSDMEGEELGMDNSEEEEEEEEEEAIAFLESALKKITLKKIGEAKTIPKTLILTGEVFGGNRVVK